MEASKVEMTTPVDGSWEKAYFYAEFDNATVIVNPPTALTKAGSTFDYTAIMATRVNDRYFVPSVQYPDSESLIDPKADFLIGKTSSSYSSSRHEQRVNLNFKRPVSLSRLAITNLEGTKVESVKITCVENDNTYNGIITGEVGYADVNFAKSTADFQANANSYELTLSYPDGLKRTATTYVYMVTIPGKKSVQSVEVVTDKYVYTKSYATPATLNFTANAFSNIAMDMTVKSGGNVTRVKREGVEMEYEDADGKPVSEFVYDLNSPAGGFPKLFVATPASAGTITYTSSNGDVASIDAEGNVTLTGNIGETVITATASGDGQYVASSASYTLKVVDNAEASKYVKVTSTDDLYAGAKYLLVFEGLAGDTDGDGDPKVFHPVLDGNTFVKNASSALDVTIVDNTITSSKFAACELTLEDGFFFMADEAGKFIYPSGTSGGSGTLSAEATASTKLDITFADGIAQIKAASGSNYFVWSVSSHYFSSNATISGQYSTGICLYMKDDGRQSQSISFSSDVAEFDVYAGDWTVGIPALSGAQTKVTYTSSNEEVATVNPSTGSVTIVSGVKKGDKAVITATAEQSESYRAASASYTINITSSDPNVPVYYKVLSNDDIYEDGQYILVYEPASKAFKPMLASSGSAFTKSTANALDVVISDNKIASADLDDCLISFEEGKYLWIESAGKYLYPGASGDSALGAENKTESHTVSISIASDGIATIARSSDATYHLYWSSSNYFSGISQTGSSYAANICIYRLDDGRQSQSISFDSDEAVYDLASGTWTTPVPNFDKSGAHTDVTFESSNTAVAVVGTNNGQITIPSTAKKGDKAVITATAGQNESYREATASYTISIVDNSAPASTYYKVTSTDDLVAGGQYLVVFEGLAGDTDGDGDPKVFNPVLNDAGTQFAKAGSSALDVTITDETITSSEFVDCQFTLENGYYLKANKADKYIYPGSSGSSSVLLAESTASNALAIAFNSGIAEIKNGSRYIVWSTSSHYFSCNSSVSSSYSTGICLYMLDDGRQAQSIAFSAEEAVFDVYKNDWEEGKSVPDLLGAKTTVKYSSSDESVAAVNPNTGAVTLAIGIKKGDKAVITATAEQDANYRAASASYTITIVSSDPVLPVYTKVDEITSGATYLIVAADAGNYNKLDKKSAFAGDEAGSSVEVDGTSGTITGDYSACEFTITAEGDAYVLNGPNGYVTGNSGTSYSRYIQVSSSQVTMSLTDAATLNAASSSDGQVSDAFYFYYTKNSSKEVLYLNSDGKYKIGGSGRKYGVYLYKKN